MAKQDKSDRQIQVAFRLPPELIERIDAHATRMSTQHPGLTFTRADAARTLLTQALDAIETDLKSRNTSAATRTTTPVMIVKRPK